LQPDEEIEIWEACLIISTELSRSIVKKALSD
jgi:hypothetical protein